MFSPPYTTGRRSIRKFRNLATGKYIRTEGEKFAKNIGIKERYQKALFDPGSYMVVCDEGHILINKKSEVSKMVKKIKTKRHIVFSGTPIHNNLLEYYYMVDFVWSRQCVVSCIQSMTLLLTCTFLNCNRNYTDQSSRHLPRKTHKNEKGETYDVDESKDGYVDSD